MSETQGRVGVRELRQNLSVYLRRVKEGETLEVTEHGEPVARLAPLPPRHLSWLERLIADGRATPAHGDLLAITRGAPPASGRPDGASMLDILLTMRDEERDP